MRLVVLMIWCVALAGVLAWNVVGHPVRELLDAQREGRVCTLDAVHLGATAFCAGAAAISLRWLLGPSAAARAAAIAGLFVALLAGALSLEADTISSLGFFATSERCITTVARLPLLGAVFVAGARGLASVG